MNRWWLNHSGQEWLCDGAEGGALEGSIVARQVISTQICFFDEFKKMSLECDIEMTLECDQAGGGEGVSTQCSSCS